MYQTILNDLTARFGANVLLTPEQIAPIIASSPAVQANLRSQGRFPIPIRRVGSKVVVSIYHLAEFIANGDVVVDSFQPEPVKRTIKATPKSKSNTVVIDKSWMTALQDIEEFHFKLVRAVEYEVLQLELEHKEPVKKSKAERGII